MRQGPRWDDAMAPGSRTMRFSFMGLADEDVDEIVAKLRGNQDVTELDMSHNHIKDKGVQTLIAALAAGAAPNLRELRINSNEFGDLGTTMLSQGLPVFQKKLEIHWK